MLPAQNPTGHIDAASVVLAAKPPRNLAHRRASARRCIARISFLRTT
jgi:hypothetical protein